MQLIKSLVHVAKTFNPMSYEGPLDMYIRGKRRLSLTYRNLILAIKLAISIEDKSKAEYIGGKKSGLGEPHSEESP